MQKEIPPVLIVGVIVVMLGLVVFGLVHAIQPHEKVVKINNEAALIAASRAKLWQQKMHPNGVIAVTTATH